MKYSYGLIFSMIGLVDALDLMFDKIQCDTSLPAYADEDGISLTCNGENRCTFGENALIQGGLHYQGLEDSGMQNDTDSGMQNNTGYVSAKLQLMTLEYDLFQFLPFKFCGDWVMNAQSNYQECPGDGMYHFEIPYQLPENDDMTTWFASGWEGVSYLKIYQSQVEASELLAQCKIHFKTFVSNSGDDNWYALPSAAQTTMILFAVLGGMLSIVLCLACRPTRKHATDEDYSQEFEAMQDEKEKEEKITKSKDEDKVEDLEERVHRLSVSMDYLKK